MDSRLQKANWIHELLLRLPKDKQRALFRSLNQICQEERMLYEKPSGGHRLIPLMVRPRLLRPFQMRYCHAIVLELQKATQTIYRHYFDDPRFQEILPFKGKEKEYFADFYRAQEGKLQTVVSRWDAASDYSGPRWKDYLRFVEWNGVGIGGIFYSVASETIIRRALLPYLRALDPSFSFAKGDDARALFLNQVRRHAKQMGFRLKRMAFVEELRDPGGPLEFEEFQVYFAKHGIDGVVVDPRDLRLRNKKIYAKGKEIDLIYRDSELEEMIEMESHGENMEAVWEAFRQNRALSSLGGELDHKSALEILSHEAFSKYFTPRQRRIFRTHVEWTRLLRPTYTTDPRGKRVDLYPYTRRHREHLVLKPNREFGGKGVVFGKDLTQREWEKALEKPFRRRGEWVIQNQAEVRRKKFLFFRKGKLEERDLSVVCGFIVTPRGISIVGRASRGEVVNVARQGGLVATMIY